MSIFDKLRGSHTFFGFLIGQKAWAHWGEVPSHKDAFTHLCSAWLGGVEKVFAGIAEEGKEAFFCACAV